MLQQIQSDMEGTAVFYSFLWNLKVKEYRKSVYNCHSYDQKSCVFFWHTVYKPVLINQNLFSEQ